jgi:sorting nexin-4
MNHLHSLIAYSHAFRAVLKLRDQKQLDFEDLSAYLSTLSAERDRLASGGAGGGMGIGAYLKEKAGALRGAAEDRDTKMMKLDSKIKEVRSATPSSCLLWFVAELESLCVAPRSGDGRPRGLGQVQ